MHLSNNENILKILDRRAASSPDKVVFSFLLDGEKVNDSLSYKQLKDKSLAIASTLRQMELKGKSALLLYPSGLDFITAFFGCLYAGVIAIPAYPPRKNRLSTRIAGMIEDASVAIVLSSSNSGIGNGGKSTFGNLPILHTDQLKQPAKHWKPLEINSDSLAYLQYTSGSTSQPKGVMVSHSNIIYNVHDIQLLCKTTSNDNMVNWLPVFHDMGLIFGILHPFYSDAHTYIMPPVAFLKKPIRWLQAISRFKARLSGGPNFAYDLCSEIAEEKLKEIDLSCWEIAINGAEPIKEKTINRFTSLLTKKGGQKKTIMPAYGLAEYTLFASAVKANDANAASLLLANSGASFVASGTASHSTQIAIVNPESLQPCEEGEEGEIWLNGPSIALGYWQRPEISKATFQNYLPDGSGPFLRTGDLGFLKDHRLAVTGRIKDMIIVRGQNYYPQDLEETTTDCHPALHSNAGAAFSIDIDGQEEVVILQELKRTALRNADGPAIINEIKKALFDQYQLTPHAVVLIRTMSILKTSSGKIQRQACKEAFLNKELNTVFEWRKANTQKPQKTNITRIGSQIKDWLLTNISDLLQTPQQAIQTDEPLSQYGFDSLRAAQLAGLIEDWTGNDFSPTLLYDYSNIEALAAYLASTATTDELEIPSSPPDSNDDIAVVGMACRFPEATNISAFWELLSEGKSGINNILSPSFQTRRLAEQIRQLPDKYQHVRWGGYLENVSDFDARFFGISPEEARRIDPQQRLLMEVSWEAFEQAGLTKEALKGSKTGVFIGMSTSDYYSLQQKKELPAHPYSGTGNAASIAANRLSYLFDLQGPSLSIDTACSSSLVAIHQACQSLQSGESDMAIAGGVNLILQPDLSLCFSEAGMLSPDGQCKTFSADANGYVRGEGCGIVLLKPLKQAIQDGDTILGRLKGSAINQDGRSNGLTAPSSRSQQHVIQRALAVAGIEPEAVGFIETHGTGTPLGDPIEFNAIKAVYGPSRQKGQPCYLGALKSNIGHLEAAAGIASFIKTLLCLQKQKVPANLNFSQMNPELTINGSGFELPNDLSEWKVEKGSKRIAGISSFGFGGTNAHLILEEVPATEQKAVQSFERSHQLLRLSTKSEAALRSMAVNYQQLFAECKITDFAAICYSASIHRSTFSYRLALVAATPEEMVKKLQNEIDKPHIGQQSHNNTALKVAFLFGGQGSQYFKMGQELYESSPLFKAQIQACEQYFSPYLEHSIIELLYTGEESDLINETLYTQALIFSVEYALAKLWLSWGIAPTAMIGHSLGEYAAACVAGVFQLKEACMLIAKRAQLMQQLPSNGQMLSVKSSLKNLLPLFEDCKKEVDIAAINSPQSIVLSGEATAIKKIASRLDEANIKNRLLKVSQAFHSPLMDDVLAPFEALLETITLHPPKFPFLSCLTSQMESELLTTPAYWVRHIRETVNFAGAAKALGNLELDACIDLSPHPILLGLLLENGTQTGAMMLSSLDKKQNNWHSLLHSIGKCYEIGAKINQEGFYQAVTFPKMPLPQYPFQKRDYWFDQGAVPIQNGQHRSYNSTANGLPFSNGASQLQHITEQVRQLTGELLGIPTQEVPLTTPLLDIGADSIVLLRALQKIDQTFKVKITPREIFEQHPHIQAIAEHIISQNPAINGLPTPSQVQEEVQSYSSNGQHRSTTNGHSMEQLMQEQLRVLKDTIDQQLEILRNQNGHSASVPSPPPLQKQVIKYDTKIMEEARPLTAQQQRFLEQLINNYCKKTPSSKKYAQQYRGVLSDWINSIDFRMLLKEMSYPIVSDRSKGARIWDKDGNEYIDLAIGYGVNFFGNSPSFIKSAIQAQLEEGFELAVQSDLSGEVAALISELTDSERITFCNSGTEAVMAAVRIARAVSGKDKIVIFNGYYHGTFDGNLAQKDFSDELGRSLPAAPGTPYNTIGDVMVLDINSEQSIEQIRAHANDIAAVLIEPVQSRRPGVFPIDFLRQIRQITSDLDIAFILDEIITGFRIHPKGAQELLGFQADITTYGKIVGGGMPIGVLAGKSKYLDAIDGGEWQYGDASYPTANTTIFGGTFCKHPLALAAAKAVLLKMKSEGPALQERVNQLTTQLAQSLNRFFKEMNVELRIDHFGSLFRFMSGGKYNPLLRPVEMDIFFRLLIEKGVFTWERRICFLSTAHTEEDVALLIKRVKSTIHDMIAGGFFPEANTAPKHHPLLEVQQQLLQLSKISEGGNIAYNICTSIGIDGQLDIPILQRAYQLLLQRHQALRLRIAVEGQEPVWVDGGAEGELVICDLEVKESEQIEAAVEEWLRKRSCEAFDLYQEALFAGYLLQATDNQQVLVFRGHHIVYDGWSVGLVISELAELYTSLKQGKTIALQTSPLFTDYIEETIQRTQLPSFQTARNYWLQLLSGMETVFELPADRPRPLLPQYGGKRIRRQLQLHSKNQLLEMGMQEGATAFMSLLAAFAILLYRLSGNRQLLIGVPVSGRTQLAYKNMTGFGASVLPLLLELEGGMSFAKVLQHVKTQLLDAYTHQQCSLPYIIETLRKENSDIQASLVPVVFNMDSNALIPQFDGKEASLLFTPISYTTHDLGIDIIDHGAYFQIECDFSTDLFDEDRIEGLLTCYEALMGNICQQPEGAIAQLSILSEAEQQMLFEFNPKANPMTELAPYSQLYTSAFPKDTAQIAAVFQSQEWSYADLESSSNQIAGLLRQLGVKSNDFVGLFHHRDFNALCAMLGILKAGAAYVPFDPQNAVERSIGQLKDSGVKHLITSTQVIQDQSTLFQKVALTHVICLNQKEKDSALEQQIGKAQLWTRIDLEACSIASLDFVNNLSDRAYMLFTSGSTGKPKGAILRHDGAVNHMLAEFRQLDIPSGFCFLQTASLSSDIHLWQFLAPIIKQGKVVIVSKEELLDFNIFLRLLAQDQPTIVELVPAYILRLLEFLDTEEAEGRMYPLPELHWMMMTGEEVPAALVNRWLRRYPHCKVINAYGPCEASDDVLQAIIEKPLPTDDMKVPIGTCLDNMNAFIVDEQLQLLPLGYVGEIVISGVGVGEGYHGLKEKTEAAFIKNPFPNTLGTTLYRTGDLGKWLPNGQMVFLGRKDQQIQIRGMRVEPGEIEGVIRTHQQIKDVVVTAERVENETKLYAYLQSRAGISKENNPLSLQTLIDNLQWHLRERLPRHMIPSVFIVLDHFPVNASGKVDRKKLVAITPLFKGGHNSYAPPETEFQRQVVGIWSEVLKKDKIGIHDNFFEIGGHSLNATAIINRITQQTGFAISLSDIFSQPTIAELSVIIQNQQHKDWPKLKQLETANYYEVSPAQKRIWIQEMSEEDMLAYHMTAAFQIKGTLDITVLNKVWLHLIERHESFRTTFHLVEGELRQQVQDAKQTNFKPVFISLKSQQKEQSVQQILADLSHTPFDLQQAPLLRITLIQTAASTYVLGISMHHIIADGWSIDVLQREIRSLYAAFNQGESIHLPTLDFQYKEYAAWQHELLLSPVTQKAKDYWLAQLPLPLTELQLPTDFNRPAVKTYEGLQYNFAFPSALSNRLIQLAKTEQVSLFVLLLSGLKVLLHKYSRQQDIIIGTPIAGRELLDLEHIIGFFINALPLRTTIDSAAPFTSVLQQVKDTCSAAYAHQVYPLDQYIEASGYQQNRSRSAVFDVFMTLDNSEEKTALVLEGLEVDPFPIEESFSQFDLTFDFLAYDQQISCTIEYNTGLFHKDRIVKTSQHLIQLFEQIATQPDALLNQLSMLSSKEQQLLSIWQEVLNIPISAIHMDWDTFEQTISEEQVSQLSLLISEKLQQEIQPGDIHLYRTPYRLLQFMESRQQSHTTTKEVINTKTNRRRGQKISL